MSGTWQPLELPDGSYKDDTRPWSQQDVAGYLPTFAEMSGTRSRLKLVTVPGLNPFNVCGTGPHRGARNVEGKLFVVSGQTLFQVFTDGSVQERGAIPGTSLVSMTHNQVAGGNQLLIGTTSNSYVWDTSDNTLTANGVPLLSVDFLNQLCLGVDSQRRFWRYSGLADATEWNSLDNESAESSPDRIVGSIVSQGEYLVFGERTVEVWLNSPTDATAFQRGPVVEKGCANANTIQRLDNSVIWLGNDNIVYRMQGYTAMPISTKAMAVSLESASQSKAFAFTYEDRGYAIYYLTFQDGKTWGYDVTNQRWHRRHSMDLDRWRLNTLVRWNGGWYGGDYTNGTLHEVVWGHALEGDDYLPRSFSSGVMHGDGNRVRVAAVKVLVDTGGEPSESADVIGLTGDAPNTYVGYSYSYTYTPVGGTPALTYSKPSGAIPTGTSLSTSTSEISGTTTAAGTFDFTVMVTDSAGLTASVRDRIVVSEIPGGINWLLMGTSAAKTSGGGLVWPAGTGVADYAANTRGYSQYGNVILTAANVSLDRGVTWQACSFPGGGGSLFGSAAGDGIYFVGDNGGNRVLRSTDGITYAAIDLPSNMISDGGVAVLGQKVLVGSTASIGGNCAASSDGGATFGGIVNAFPLVVSGSPSVKSIAASSTLFMVVGHTNTGTYPRISTTSDGVTFSEKSGLPFNSLAELNVVKHAGGRWMVGASSGEIAYSDDNGATWTLSSYTFPVSVTDLSGDGNGYWVVVGGSDYIAFSDDNGASFFLADSNYAAQQTHRSVHAIVPATP